MTRNQGFAHLSFKWRRGTHRPSYTHCAVSCWYSSDANGGREGGTPPATLCFLSSISRIISNVASRRRRNLLDGIKGNGRMCAHTTWRCRFSAVLYYSYIVQSQVLVKTCLNKVCKKNNRAAGLRGNPAGLGRGHEA